MFCKQSERSRSAFENCATLYIAARLATLSQANILCRFRQHGEYRRITFPKFLRYRVKTIKNSQVLTKIISSKDNLTQAYEEPAEEKPPAQDRKNVEILMQAIDEMKKLGFNSLEEYLAYKDEQSLKGLKKNPIEM